MSFLVDDGTNSEEANSFASVEFADSYFTLRGVAGWTGTESEKQSYLVRATDYIKGRFRLKDYPEEDGVPYVPENLRRATAEYALRSRVSSLAPDPVMDPKNQNVTGETKKVGPLEKTVQYGSRFYMFRPYPAADMLLKGLVNITRGVIR